MSSFIERIKQLKKISVSIDYVEFADGTSWGADIEKESERISGRMAGRFSAIEELKFQIRAGKTNETEELLKREVTEVTPLISDLKQSAKWQDGFRQGYRSVLIQLQFALEGGGMSSVLTRLKELEDFHSKWEKKK